MFIKLYLFMLFHCKHVRLSRAE